MNLYIAASVVLFLVIGFVARASAGLDETEALDLLARGAIVIDVRSEGEFADKRIEGVLNIPLPELEARIAKVVPDMDSIILLHCRSGNRSGQGVRLLKALGYEKTYNLGSFGHARKVLDAAAAKVD